jgi:hypothetical protein
MSFDYDLFVIGAGSALKQRSGSAKDNAACKRQAEALI